jgi:HAD superfamily hydrolase (TIGR01509 family)
MFTAAIFDMDGLLIDSEQAIMEAWILAADRLGITLLPTDYLQVVGRSLPDARAFLSPFLGGDALFNSAISLVRQHLSERPAGLRFPLKPGAAPLLQSLFDAHIPCAVASSSAHAEIRDRLGAVGVLHYFSAVAGGDEVVRGKPDPAIYQLAAARLGHPAIDCLAFEDSENGARAAIAAGIKVIVVPDLKQPSRAIVNQSLVVLHSLGEAIERIPNWFGRTSEIHGSRI